MCALSIDLDNALQNTRLQPDRYDEVHG